MKRLEFIHCGGVVKGEHRSTAVVRQSVKDMLILVTSVIYCEAGPQQGCQKRSNFTHMWLQRMGTKKTLNKAGLSIKVWPSLCAQGWYLERHKCAHNFMGNDQGCQLRRVFACVVAAGKCLVSLHVETSKPWICKYFLLTFVVSLIQPEEGYVSAETCIRICTINKFLCLHRIYFWLYWKEAGRNYLKIRK
jgi:hypothetical protein